MPKLLGDILSKFNLWKVDTLRDLMDNPAASMRLKRKILDRIGEFSEHYEVLGIHKPADIPVFVATNRNKDRTLFDILPVADYCVLKTLCGITESSKTSPKETKKLGRPVKVQSRKDR